MLDERSAQTNPTNKIVLDKQKMLDGKFDRDQTFYLT